MSAFLTLARLRTLTTLRRGLIADHGAARRRRAARRFRPFFIRTLSILLCLSFFTTSAPAASHVLPALASEVRLGWALWLESSGVAFALKEMIGGQSRPKAQKQEDQTKRDARVARLAISPGAVTLRTGERLRFAAVAYDGQGATVGGVKYTWQAFDAERGKPTRISPVGDFVAGAAGAYKVRVEGGGQAAEVTVTAVDDQYTKRKKTKRKEGQAEEQPEVRNISTRDLAPAELSEAKRKRRGAEQARGRGADAPRFIKASYVPAAAAPAPAYFLPAESWNENNYPYVDDPGNERGDPPGSPQDDGAGNGNFQIAAPLLSLPGRQLDLTLGLVYNSKLWTKGGAEITYDIDKDWPAPGWSLGFGKVIGMGAGGSVLVEPDGTRHAFAGTATSYSWGATYFSGYTADGSLIDYSTDSYGGAISGGYARLPNGTEVFYGAAWDGAAYPIQISEVNGNYLNITYRNNRGPQIDTVTDTLGRVVQFHYGANSLLTAVTAPGLGGGTRTLVRLHYRQHYLNYGFSGLTPRVRNSAPWVIDAVYYPGTGTGYWFGDADSYSSYGMIAKVSERRGMGFSAGSLNDHGVVTSAGSESVRASYDYPMSPNYSLTDAPTYPKMTASWDGMDTAPVETLYASQQNTTNPAYPEVPSRKIEITLPNGTKNTQYSYNYSSLADTNPLKFKDGIAYHDETRDAAGNLLHSSAVTWEKGAYETPRPVRMEATNHEIGKKTATVYEYGPSYNQATAIHSYDYADPSATPTALTRTVRTEYENGVNYTNRHIFNLAKSVDVFGPDGVRAARTEYVYDGAPLQDAPGVVMHFATHNPHAPQYWVEEYCWEECYDDGWGSTYCNYYCNPGYWTTDYQQHTDYRGNATQVKSYANAASLTGAVVETYTYDITGNTVTASTSCCEQTTFSFTSATQYTYSTAQSRGSVSDASARVSTGIAYDFSTGLVLSETDANGRTSQSTYQPDTLRTSEVIAPTGARTSHLYDDVQQTVTETTTAAPAEGGAVAEKTVKHLNGIGLTRREEALGAGGAWDAVETRYDHMGRVWKQSRPYRVGVEQPQLSESVYDALSRAVEIIAPDGSRSRAFYNEAARPGSASAAPGETIRVVDAWGRDRWSRSDVQGRLVEVVEPEGNGPGSVLGGGNMVTSYGYDTLGNLTLVTQGAQQRSFGYDSFGRLTRQKQAEAGATLNDAGQYVGVGGAGALWSDYFTYDARSNVTARKDARGVVASFDYNGDPLSRLRSVSYGIGSPGDTSSPVHAAAGVTYEYMTTGDVTRVRQVRAAGVSTDDYAYDAEGRLTEHKLTLDSRPARPLVTNYGHDSLDRTVSVTYPQQYPSGTRKTLTHSFDAASRLSGLQVNGASYASDIAYNSASQTTSLNIGLGVGNWKQEKYEYDSVTGLLKSQKVLRAGDENQKLLHLEYDYLRPGAAGRTGQLTKITNHLDRAKDRAYEYDALGRLRRAVGGVNGNWAQRYHYDRYGNRWNTFSKMVEQFVRDFYQMALARQPDAAELQTWINALRTAYAQGQGELLNQAKNLGDAVFGSAEYAARNRSDRDYVYDLYRAFLGRTPDQGGWDFWTSVVPSDGRANVRNGFKFSEEFSLNVSGLSPYGLPAGGAAPVDGLGALSFDAATNRLNAPGYAYDAAGNQTRARRSDGAWQRYQYDAAGRLVRVTDDAGNALAINTYGATNARLVSQEGSTRTYYAWGGSGVVAEYTETDGTGSQYSPQWSKIYIYLGARLLATQTPGAIGELVQYQHADRLGTRLVTNAYDVGAAEQDALPFGTSLDATAATSKRFTSYDRSPATRLDYAVNRHYDPSQGRFTQVDPVGINASSLADPQTLNLYAYCANDPVNRLDPDGLFWNPFKAIWKGVKAIWGAVGKAILKVVKVTLQVALKVLSSKWGQFVIALAIMALASPAFAPLLFATEGAAIGLSTANLLIGGVIAAGSVANHLQQRRGRRGQQKSEKPKEPLAKRIARIAAANIGEEAWRTSRARKRNGKNFPEGSNKCNQFVYDVLKKAGAPAPTSGGKGQWPAQAGEWGDPNVKDLQGWVIVEGGYDARQPGDVISQAHGQGATGHVAIVGPDRSTIGTGVNDGVISSTDWGGRLGQGSGWGILTGQSTKSVVVRRCTAQ